MRTRLVPSPRSVDSVPGSLAPGRRGALVAIALIAVARLAAAQEPPPRPAAQAAPVPSAARAAPAPSAAQASPTASDAQAAPPPSALQASPTPSTAQARGDRVEVLDPVVVSATRTPTPVGETGSSVSVIDQPEIQARQMTDMLEILRDVPGLTVIQTGSRGGNTNIFTRGGNSNMNQVLIDGMKINDAGGAFDFATLTTVGIGRAEIVRGPQSALYGPDAMTGVLQFFTPRGEGPFSVWGSVKGGNYSTDEERIGASWGQRLGGAFFEFGRVHSGGILDVNDGYTNYTAALRLDLEPIPDLAFTLTGRYINSTFHFPTENGDLVDPFPDPHQFVDSDRFVGTFGVRYRQASWIEHR